jgi:hypothetical protein
MKLSVCALFLSLLVSCLQTTVNVYVRSDGAGQVQETVLLTHDAVELLRGLQALDSDEEFSLIERAMLADAAVRMGPGVRLVSAVPIETGAADGYEALFAFDRVDDLVLEGNYGERLQLTGLTPLDTFASDELIRFGFSRNDVSKLSVAFVSGTDDTLGAEPEYPDGYGEPSPGPSELDRMTMREYYRGMKYALTVAVDGSIVETDASYVRDGTVTLMKIDFDLFLDKTAAAEELFYGKYDTLESLRSLAEGIPGMLIEPRDTIEVIFR